VNASVTARTESGAVDPVYLLRDDLACTYNPANAHERMLVTAIAQAWQSLQQAHELKRRVFEKTDPLELFSSDLDRFKTIHRLVADCERMWRRAMDELGRAQRRRLRETLASPNARRDRPPAPVVPVTVDKANPIAAAGAAAERTQFSPFEPPRPVARDEMNPTPAPSSLPQRAPDKTNPIADRDAGAKRTQFAPLELPPPIARFDRTNPISAPDAVAERTQFSLPEPPAHPAKAKRSQFAPSSPAGTVIIKTESTPPNA
jgi:hypothetical protein